MQVGVAFAGVDHFGQASRNIEGEVGGITPNRLANPVIDPVVDGLNDILVALGFYQAIGRIPAIGHHACIFQITIIIKSIALAIDTRQPISIVIDVAGRIHR